MDKADEEISRPAIILWPVENEIHALRDETSGR